MPSFEIPDGPTAVPLKAGTAAGQPTRTGSATYSVTNKSTGGLAGRFSVQVAGDAKAEWFTVDGEKERQFAPGETQTVTVNINVPAAVKPGAYKFRPRVVAVNDPDNDHTDGPVATLQVAAGAKPPVDNGGTKFPIWIIFVIIAAVLVIGGGILAFVLFSGGGGGDKTAIADLSGKPVAEAEALLADMKLDLVVKKQELEKADVPAGTVFDQSPKADEPLEKGQEVLLSVAVGPSVAVPDVTTRSFDNASGVLEGVGLKAERVAGEATGKAPETVMAQEPGAGGRAGQGSAVKLTVDPGIPMPPLTNRQLEQAVRDAGGKVSITGVGARCENGTVDQVVSQSVPAGTMVAKFSSVSVTVRKPVGYPCWGRYIGIERYRDLRASSVVLPKK